MKLSTLDKYFARTLAVIVAVVIALVPFHAFLTVWGSSLVGHYTLLRLWKEFLLLAGFILALYLVVRDRRLARKIFGAKIVWLIMLYTLLVLAIGGISYLTHRVSHKALAYGVLVDLRFLAFFAVAWVAAETTGWLRRAWQWLLLAPAGLVVIFGLLQKYLLPYDFLKHFGYSLKHNISPYETIDHKLGYIRLQSTLRGANPLGAYLVVVIAALLVALKTKLKNWKLVFGLMLLAAIIVLAYSYSRSAWLGTAVAAAGLAWLGLGSRRGRLLALAGLVLVAIVAAGGLVALRHNDRVQNTFFHTDEHSRSAESSNTGHVEALEVGVSDVVHQPLGRGPGTAGPASFYNGKPRIAEDYFVQIAQETGVLGLVLFLAIYAAAARGLWRQRRDRLSQVLLVSLAGLTLVNLLSHAWTDDTLSYLWWGLLGLAYAYPSTPNKAKNAEEN